MSTSFMSPIWSHFFVGELYYITYYVYYMYDARMLRWWHLCVHSRESAQPVVTDGITVTPTSPARWTRKTSAVSSVTVATSFSGCTCGITSSCDGQQPHVLHFSPCRPGPPLQTNHNHLCGKKMATWPASHFQRVQIFKKRNYQYVTTVLSSTTQDWLMRLSAPEPLLFYLPDKHIEHWELWKAHKLTHTQKSTSSNF